MSRLAAAAALLAGALALAGCAAPRQSTGPAPPAAAAVPATTVAATPAPAPAGPPPPRPVLAVADTVPSADALAVLAGIPEPIRAEEGAAAPVTASPATGTPAGAAPGPADEGGGGTDVPVPARTPVLGERPLPDVVAPAAPAAAPARPAAPAAGAAAPDTCWRVQLAAWADRAKAGGYLAAARSQLGVPLAIEEQAGLFKVRSVGCLDGAAADALRGRAREAGFEGAFRFRGGKP